MYIESVPNRSSPPAVLLRESYRDGRRVKKRTLANLSKLPPAAIDMLRRVLRGEQLVNPDDAFTCVRSLPHGHVAAVLGTLQQLGLCTLIARGAGRLRDLVVALIVARVIDARSKLATVRALTAESAVSTLGELLGLGEVDQHELYAAMDWLVERQAAIEQRLAKRHLREHTLVLYDLTSSYVPLPAAGARRGHVPPVQTDPRRPPPCEGVRGATARSHGGVHRAEQEVGTRQGAVLCGHSVIVDDFDTRSVRRVEPCNKPLAVTLLTCSPAGLFPTWHPSLNRIPANLGIPFANEPGPTPSLASLSCRWFATAGGSG